MDRFYMNKNEQPTGEHEVHRTYSTCPTHADPANRRDLGEHPDCKSALAAARQIARNVDGCAHCVPDCHTR